MPPQPRSPHLNFQFAVRSDVGIVRANNEDAAYARSDCLILADGMGGHASGEVASAVAVHTFASTPATGPDAFTSAARHTRELLRTMSAADENLETMGTTIVAIRRDGDTFHACHIGDSRLYRFSGGELTRLTTDHTHVQHLVEMGRITPEQIPTHPYRAMLLKSLDDQPGGSPPDLLDLDLGEGDRLLLCSDGLSDYVPDPLISRALDQPDAQRAADDLIAAALQGGTRDNITVIVADITPEEPPGETFAGAAAEPLALSPDARGALTGVDPQFAVHLPGEPDSTPDRAAASVTRPRPSPWAGVLAAGAVLAVLTGIALVV